MATVKIQGIDVSKFDWTSFKFQNIHIQTPNEQTKFKKYSAKWKDMNQEAYIIVSTQRYSNNLFPLLAMVNQNVKISFQNVFVPSPFESPEVFQNNFLEHLDIDNIVGIEFASLYNNETDNEFSSYKLVCSNYRLAGYKGMDVYRMVCDASASTTPESACCKKTSVSFGVDEKNKISFLY